MASDGSTSIATLATRVPTRMGWVIYKPCSAMKALHGPHYSSVQCRPRHQRGMDSTSQVPRVRDILTTDAAGHPLRSRLGSGPFLPPPRPLPPWPRMPGWRLPRPRLRPRILHTVPVLRRQRASDRRALAGGAVRQCTEIL
jgi:hypothetical protein